MMVVAMNLLQRLRKPDRGTGILVWMLLLAVACAPLARAMAPAQRTVLVPFCAPGASGTQGHDGHDTPRHIALRFTAATAGTAPTPGPALPASPATLPHGVAAGMSVGLARPAPVQPVPITRRPPPRGPPAGRA